MADVHSPTPVASGSCSFADGTSYQIEVQAVGVEIKVLIDGTEIVKGISNNNLSGQKFGVGRIG